MNKVQLNSDFISINRSGKISDTQLDYIESGYRYMPRRYTAVIIIGVLVVLTVVTAYLTSTDIGDIGTLLVPAAIPSFIIGIIISKWVGSNRAQRRMVNMSVERLRGQVVWKHNQYMAESGGRILDSIIEDVSDLQPGDYTFYVLHGSDLILSAEPLSEEKHDTTKEDPRHSTPLSIEQLESLVEKGVDSDSVQSPEQAALRISELQRVASQFNDLDPSQLSAADIKRLQELGQKMGQQMQKLIAVHAANHSLMSLMKTLGNDFKQATLPPLDGHGMAELQRALEETGIANAGALETNRQGRQTAGQRIAHLRQVWHSFLIGLAAITVGVWASISEGSKHDSRLLMVLLGCTVAVLWAITDGRREFSDWSSGRAERVEGIASKRIHTYSGTRGGGGVIYYLEILQLSFAISRTAYDALVEGHTYRIYYSPKSKMLLNIEPV